MRSREGKERKEKNIFTSLQSGFTAYQELSGLLCVCEINSTQW